MPSRAHFYRSALLSTIAAAAFCLMGAGVASAHVTIDPDEIAAGESNQLTFQVPNESRTANIVKLELTFPADTPITSVRTAPMSGWKPEVIKGKLERAVRSGAVTITEAVRTVTWTADPGNGITPGQYGQFQVLTGSIPDTGDTLVIPATETYSDGQVVRWNQLPPADGTEPEHPAPVVRITELSTHLHGAAAATRSDPAGSFKGAPQGNTDSTARWMAGTGLLIGALGLGAGAGSIAANRRRNVGERSDGAEHRHEHGHGRCQHRPEQHGAQGEGQPDSGSGPVGREE